MAQPNACLGHKEREVRRNKIAKLVPVPAPDLSLRVLIKKGPVSKSMDTSLKELRRMRGLLYIYICILLDG